ncbi:MAG: hypothetical protein ABR981_01900 [Candidatus Micrarchaeaceae archaeon]|jgi:hypothetical protein
MTILVKSEQEIRAKPDERIARILLRQSDTQARDVFLLDRSSMLLNTTPSLLEKRIFLIDEASLPKLRSYLDDNRVGYEVIN